MSLEGSIKTFSLADIFQLIGIQRKTGVLTLQHGDEEVKVSFLNGMVVNADSRSKRLDDRLGSVLVKTGKLTPEALKRALKVQKDTLKKIGHVLLEEGLVRAEDLREALNIQITQIIYRLFRWKDGDYHFEQDVAVDYDKENFTPMSAESILMEGMRMIDEWPIIERKISSFDMVFERVQLGAGEEPVVEEGGGEEEAKGDDFDLVFGAEKKKAAAPAADDGSHRIKLTREENVVYQQVNGKATVQEIIERTMLSEFETCRALYDLTSRNLIAPVAAPAKSEARAREAPGVDVSSYAARALYLVLAAALVVSALFMAKNPLNVVVPPLEARPAVAGLEREVALARARRLSEAAETYVLVNGAAPQSAADLVKEGLVTEADVRDPWGSPLGFELQGNRVVVTTRTAGTADAPTVKLERVLPG